ncbi:MAG: MBL fold metallo-hydrolase, partial [Proteobacteria bacterium]|nr:MBL fold metallo-hydrolase [Pseudomonadota bacterium]
IPTSAHIPVSWRMAYDNYPLTIIKEKEEYLARALEDKWILFFEHDPVIAAASVIINETSIRLDKKFFL